ncbi:SDR family oxidoreductase [Pseudomonas sp. ADAK13]|uniref:SDR family oxidoreductase n=1 Tax=Pseudomonas sp. ADAK13 TaxID=2730847 RepID=UPI001463EB55|nr:SDR family oxidoreductase [Pseudomonas sp. ADAK13]QJI37961.1 SDR family oxidoreductase [Pseudomonas sp. ADAK13]
MIVDQLYGQGIQRSPNPRQLCRAGSYPRADCDDAYEKYPGIAEHMASITAMGRLGEAGDVGVVIASLLSDDFRWITGQNIEASGGVGLSSNI